jgi:hypothetical protein
VKIELYPTLVVACKQLSETDTRSLAGLNKAAWIGEEVAKIVMAKIAKHAELVAKRDKLLADHRAGNIDITVAGYALGALDEEIKGIERALGK